MFFDAFHLRGTLRCWETSAARSLSLIGAPPAPPSSAPAASRANRCRSCLPRSSAWMAWRAFLFCFVWFGLVVGD
eukprot:COSAG01_NODE_1142_length_11533_cov_9.907381_7_plen_75_part_00